MKTHNALTLWEAVKIRSLHALRLAFLVVLSLMCRHAGVTHLMAAWSPPQGSVPPPTVVTIFPWDVEPLAPNGMLQGSRPWPPLVVGPDEALYGVMTQGGNPGNNPWQYGNGTLFKLQPDGSFTELHVFTWEDGSYFTIDYTSPTLNVPQIVIAPDGTIYGTTPGGGTVGAGTLFKFATDGTFTMLHDFIPDGVDGYLPDTGLVWGPDGALYGTTVYGGADGQGTIFRVDTNGNYTVLHSFSYEDGGLFNVNYDTQEFKDSSLVVGVDGALYGVTPAGGPSAYGTIFKIQIDGTFTKLHYFTDAPSTRSALAAGVDGALYGWTPSGFFKVTPDGDFTYIGGTTFSTFAPPAMTPGSDGALYGSAQFLSGPVIYRLLTNGVVTVLHHLPSGLLSAPLVAGPDGALYGSTLSGEFFKVETNGTVTTLWDSRINGGGTSGAVAGALVLGPDGALYGCGGLANSMCKLVLPVTRPLVQGLNPAKAIAGSGEVSITITGVGFLGGARVFFDDAEVAVSYLGTTQLQAIIPASALPSPIDFATVQVTVLNPGSTASKPAAFTIIGTGVSGSVGQVDSGVAGVGETVAVETLPSAPDSAGVTASLENASGTTPATVTAATYTENPTPAAAFEAGGGFVDLQVSGADPGDRLSTAFYYPQTVTGAAETALALKFFNGSAWIDVLSSGGMPPAKDTTDNLDGTISGGRFHVVFDNTSTPKITELNGTVFAVAIPDATPPTVSCPNVTVPCDVNLLVPVTYPAPTVSDNIDPAPSVTYSIPRGSGFGVGTTTVTCTVTDAAGNSRSTTFTVTRAPLGFTGFLSPIGGSDATGGSFAAPVRTFKAGSTMPVKFTANCGGAPVTSGVHRLQAIKYSNSTTAGTPIDATPQDAATTGNEFRLTSGEWHFNLDTKATGITQGIWQLVATLSDGSQHAAWVQIK